MLTSLVLLALPLGYDCMITVQPEVLVVVDVSLHASLGGDLLTTSQYVRNFWSAVNLRFRALSIPAVELVVVGMEVGQPLSVAQHLEMVEEEVAGPLLQQILVVRRQQLRVVVEELETVVEVRPQLQHTLAAQQQPQEVEEEEVQL